MSKKHYRIHTLIPTLLILLFLVSPIIYILFQQIRDRFQAQATTSTQASTTVSIQGAQFLINGRVPSSGLAAQGLLLNSRMIQGVFDDENPATVSKWAYPDTHRWDAQRNTNELVVAIPFYARHGLRLITVGLQGGGPDPAYPQPQPWIVTAFRPDGSLKPAWMHRLDQVIRAANANGMVVDVSLFYWQQVRRLQSEQAVINAINHVTDWLVAGGYTNVLVEIANECNSPHFYSYVSRDVVKAIRQVQIRSRGKLKVSVSYTGGTIPPAAVIKQADYIELHGNGQSPDGIVSMINTVRAMPAYQAKPKPILFNEDSTRLANMDAAVQAGASWGYYDQGRNNYVDGFQSPPVNWQINTPAKSAFFNHVLSLAGRGGLTRFSNFPKVPTQSSYFVLSSLEYDRD